MISPQNKRLRSKIWLSFNIDANDSGRAICKVCKCSVSRGRSAGDSQCTTNLWCHVRSKHPTLAGELAQMRKKDEIQKKQVVAISDLKEPKEKNIWELYYFNSQTPSTAWCLQCNTCILHEQGTTRVSLMWNHIKAKHPNTYAITKKRKSSQNSFPTSSRGKTSSVWTEFVKDPSNICQVICKTCNTIVKRGSSADRLNTTNMRRHLEGMFHRNILKKRKKNMLPPSGILVNEPCEENIEISTHPIDCISTSTQLNLPSLSSVERVIAQREVDTTHTALIMHTLYEQQKRDACCDFSIYTPNDRDSFKYEVTKSPVVDESENISYYASRDRYEFKVHSCVISAISDKLKTIIQFGSSSFDLGDVGKYALSSFIEIVYTGKLTGIGSVEKLHLQEIYNVAQALWSPIVIDYLKRECPRIIFNEQLRHEPELEFIQQMNAFNTQPRSSNSPPSQSMNSLHSLRSLGPDNNTSTEMPSENLHPNKEPSIPKVNKRKNYLPVSTENNKKKIKLESNYAYDGAPNLDHSLVSSLVVPINTLDSFEYRIKDIQARSFVGQGENSPIGETIESNCDTLYEDKSLQVDSVGEEEAHDRILYSSHQDRGGTTSNSFFKIVEIMRDSASQHLRGMAENVVFNPDPLVMKSWMDVLSKICPGSEYENDPYISVSSMSKRCWDLYKEIKSMSDIPDRSSTWGWVAGLPEPRVFFNLIVLFRNPYHIALEKISSRYSESFSADTLISPILNTKGTQLTSDY